MWQAKIIQKIRYQDTLTVVVEYSNGTDSFTRNYPVNFDTVDIDYIYMEMKRKITTLNALDALEQPDVIKEGAVDLSAVELPVTPKGPVI